MNSNFEVNCCPEEYKAWCIEAINSICAKVFNKRLILVSHFNQLILVVILTVLMKANEQTT